MNWFRNLFFQIRFGVRSSHWGDVRKAHLKKHPKCEVCGKKPEVHHIKPYHLHRELELDPNNLISLCRTDHFLFGHLCDWKAYNPEARKDTDIFSYKISERKYD